MVEEKEAPQEGIIDKALLAILCCPETKQEVSLIDGGTLDQLNAAIEKGELRNTAGNPVKEKLDGGLIRKDGKVVYPIRDQIPIMLIEEGIVINELPSSST